MISVCLRVILPRMTRVAAAGSQQVAVLGAGTVGSALLDRLGIMDRFGVSGVLVRDAARPRELAAGKAVVTEDPQQALAGADLVVELMGGTGLAKDLMLQALSEGKPVITGNKAAVAEHWEEFLPYMERGLLHFEAAVMAGTPALAPLTQVLRGSEPLGLAAILNGTCSYIIGQLDAGESFAAALGRAQDLGYAEADPTFDIEGFDTAHKLAIMGRLAFDPDLPWEQVRASCTGITELTPELVSAAGTDGARVALLGSIRAGPDGWETKVEPVRLLPEHPLSRISAELNGYVYSGRQGGAVLIAGPGAGGAATASAVLADLLAAADGRPGPAPLRQAAPLPDKAGDSLTEPVRATV